MELARNGISFRQQMPLPPSSRHQSRASSSSLSPTSNYTFESRQIAAMPSRRNGSISFNRANRSTMSMTSHRSQITSNDENYWRARMQADLSLQAEYSTHSTINSNSTQHSQTQPPASQHRVYLLNCKSCGAFLTDRGMKAVLLLRPHITLFSTDAMPNCGPLHPPSRLAEPSGPNEPIVERTCDCLTQTLGCFGCGTAVGYHIVSPCQRCTSSVAKHQRTSNGHRTVLHCAEITIRERRYVPGEPGVRCAAIPSTMPIWQREAAMFHHYPSSRTRSSNRQPRNAAQNIWSHQESHDFEDEMNESADKLARDEEDEEDEEEDDDDDENDEEEEEEELLSNDYVVHHQQPNSAFTPRYSNLPINSNNGRRLKRGDVVYWSDLQDGGERCAPFDSDQILEMPIAGR